MKEFETADKNIVEALLFASGDSLSTDQMAHATNLTPGTCRAICLALQEEYNEAERGIQILELEGRFQMTTRPQYYEHVRMLFRSVQKEELTDIQMEVLAIVAYKQPITKQEIDDIRGVHSDHLVNKLIEFGLVEEVGRMKAPGRPILLGTTEAFLKNFGFSSVRDIPNFPEENAERLEQMSLDDEMEMGENGDNASFIET